MDCRIERICGEGESAWMIGIPTESAAEVVVRFAAFHLEKLKGIRFEDRENRLSVEVVRQKENGKEEAYAVRLGDELFDMTKDALEAVVAMLVDVAMYGWYQAAHVDVEVERAQGSATVCFGVKQLIK